ncbi:MAG: Glu-tRNA(Gln) amidotransferase subunit GatE [Candidatus Omnitrophota bacterium]
MTKPFDAEKNYERSRKTVGYISRNRADAKIYSDLGFKCGLEVHQQLLTRKKLFCRCPGGIYHDSDDFHAEVIRHMRPTLSELGEYDGTALMEFKTKKNIVYRLNNKTACTYEVDDTPPFPVNREALDIAIEVALLLRTNVVGELHITRKQYLDGSIPTGFQRTAIVGIEGEIPISKKKIRIIQLSVEEDSCREVSDIGHERIYLTDRLGMPLIETVTYPDMLTPDEAAEAGHYIRFLTRSTGKVRTGIGAGREDVNVSITGGTRVEIKGVAHIRLIPELTHNEAFRQKALLEIKTLLHQRIPDPSTWHLTHAELSPSQIPDGLPIHPNHGDNVRVIAVNLPQFKDVLSFFTQPGKSFSNELSDRLKVIACIEKPNMIHSEPWNVNAIYNPRQHLDANGDLNRIQIDFAPIRELLQSGANDAQLLFWASPEDMATALETIEERCLLAMTRGVLNETRKFLMDGTTLFERVLPGPDRMYPDTDSAPISIEESQIQAIRKGLPSEVSRSMKHMLEWGVPVDAYPYILKRNLFPLIEKIVEDFNQPPRFTGILIGHHLKYLEGRIQPASHFDYHGIYHLFEFIIRKKLKRDILKEMLPVVYEHPKMDFESVLTTIGYKPLNEEEILDHIPILKDKFHEISKSKDKDAMVLWVMGRLKPLALGNMNMNELRNHVTVGYGNEAPDVNAN